MINHTLQHLRLFPALIACCAQRPALLHHRASVFAISICGAWLYAPIFFVGNYLLCMCKLTCVWRRLNFSLCLLTANWKHGAKHAWNSNTFTNFNYVIQVAAAMCVCRYACMFQVYLSQKRVTFCVTKSNSHEFHTRHLGNGAPRASSTTGGSHQINRSTACLLPVCFSLSWRVHAVLYALN